MDNTKRRFFIALLPPQEIQDYAKEIQQHFAQTYASKGAQKSPPHITLQPPFEWQVEAVPVLEESLRTFASHRSPVSITLEGFGAFPPRVIYINVLKTPELLALQADLMTEMETNLGIADSVSKQRPFAPHMTVAFRDLTRQNFKLAWAEFQERPLQFEFTAAQLTLLIHTGERWEVSSDFPCLARRR
ncbi:2'-5' RNA ligase family protein [Coleofasciculus sp. FACHB-129]|uniref:2'-5' RNA ligase family protein n=1 Tax=Cyanophyceae TaxID=3028117 RepID=UPI0016820AF0|nr:2'-5' RNA ligase family protein [Coleofasciculus sp. FACHB-129]MBD1894728.1 2'-5' RNA ligase family protein [Coleofasciculus sp. FACHB-129]